MNGATEATLAELLAVARLMNANIQALQRIVRDSGGSGGGGGGAASSLNPLSAAAGAVRLAFRAVGSAIEGVTAVIGKLVGGIMGAVSGLISFSAAAAKGTATLSTLFESFSRLPFLLGEISTIFANIVRYSESLLQSWRQITDNGVGLAGNLVRIRIAAGQMGVGVEKLTEVVKNNADIFATLNQNANAGFEKFINIQTALFGPNSRFRSSILSMGYTAEQAADLTATYIRMQGTMNRRALDNNDQVAASVAKMATEIDLYSRITGQSREKAAAELRDKAFDQSLQAFMSGLEGDALQRAQMQQKIAGDLSDGVLDIVRSLQMSNGQIALATEKARTVFVQTGGQAETLARQFIEATRNTKEGTTEFFTAVERFRVGIANSGEGFIRQFGDTAGTFNVIQNRFFTDQKLLQTITQNRGRDEASIANAALKAARDRQDAERSAAAALARVNQSIRDYGNKIFGQVAQFIEPLLPQLYGFGQGVVNFATMLIDKAGPYVKKFIEFWRKEIYPRLEEFGRWLQGWIGKIVESKGLDEFWKNTKSAFTEGLNKYFWPAWESSIKPALLTAWEGILDFMKPYFVRMIDEIIDKVNAWAYSVVPTDAIRSRAGIEDPAVRAKNREEQYAKADYEKFKKDFIKAKEETRPKQVLDEMYTKLIEAAKKYYFKMNPSTQQTEVNWQLGRINMNIPERAMTSLGATGKLLENWGKGTPVMLHGEEGVVNREQIQAIAASGTYNLAPALDRLNTLTAQMISEMKENNQISRKILSATKSIGGDLFA